MITVPKSTEKGAGPQNGTVDPRYNDGSRLVDAAGVAAPAGGAGLSAAQSLNYERTSHTNASPDNTPAFDPLHGRTKASQAKRAKIFKDVVECNQSQRGNASKFKASAKGCGFG